MCTHSPVTVCCALVCVSARAVGLTVSPAGRDVVDMVSFLADSAHKGSVESNNRPTRCETIPQHTVVIIIRHAELIAA